MAAPNRYNGAGPLAGVIIEGQVDPTTGQVTPPTGGSSTSPQYVTAAQNTPTFSASLPVAITAADLMLADATRHGARLLNYAATAVYFQPTVVGATPALGAPSDVVPAASGGLPGQYEFPYAPTGAYRYISSGTGSALTGLVVETW